MSKVTVTVEDTIIPGEDGGDDKPGVVMHIDADISDEEKELPATAAQLLAMTIKRLFEQKRFDQLVPVVCHDMMVAPPMRTHAVENPEIKGEGEGEAVSE